MCSPVSLSMRSRLLLGDHWPPFSLGCDRKCTSTGIYGQINWICCWCPCRRSIGVFSTGRTPPPLCTGIMNYTAGHWQWSSTGLLTDCVCLSRVWLQRISNSLHFISHTATNCGEGPHKHCLIYGCNYMAVITERTLLHRQSKTTIYITVK